MLVSRSSSSVEQSTSLSTFSIRLPLVEIFELAIDKRAFASVARDDLQVTGVGLDTLLPESERV